MKKFMQEESEKMIPVAEPLRLVQMNEFNEFRNNSFRQYELETTSGEYDPIINIAYKGLYEWRYADGTGPVCMCVNPIGVFNPIFHCVMRFFRNEKIAFFCNIDGFIATWKKLGMKTLFKRYKDQGYRVIAYDHEIRPNYSIRNFDEWYREGKGYADKDFEKYIASYEAFNYGTREQVISLRGIFEWIEEENLIDEIWSYSIFNILDFGSQHKIPIKYFIPFSTKVYDYQPEEKKYDILFFGNDDTQYRKDMIGGLRWLADTKGYSLKVFHNEECDDINPYIRQTKIVVNIPSFENRPDSEVLRMYQVLGNYSLLLTRRVAGSQFAYDDVPYYYDDKDGMLNFIVDTLDKNTWEQKLIAQQAKWSELSSYIFEKFK